MFIILASVIHVNLMKLFLTISSMGALLQEVIFCYEKFYMICKKSIDWYFTIKTNFQHRLLNFNLKKLELLVWGNHNQYQKSGSWITIIEIIDILENNQYQYC